MSIHRSRMKQWAQSINPDVTERDIDWLVECLPESSSFSNTLDREIQQANQVAIDQGTFKMFRLNSNRTKTDIAEE